MAAKRKARGKRQKRQDAPGSTEGGAVSPDGALEHVAALEVPRRPYVAPTLTSSPAGERPGFNVAPSQFALNEDPACGDSPTGGSDDE